MKELFLGGGFLAFAIYGFWLMKKISLFVSDNKRALRGEEPKEKPERWYELLWRK